MQFNQLINMHKQGELGDLEIIRQQRRGGGMAGMTERSERAINRLKGSKLSLYNSFNRSELVHHIMCVFHVIVCEK